MRRTPTLRHRCADHISYVFFRTDRDCRERPERRAVRDGGGLSIGPEEKTMRLVWWTVGTLALGSATLVAACDDAADGAGGAGTGSTVSGTGQSSSAQSSTATGLATDTQTPPQEAVALEAWLAKGDYKTWSCEPAVHAARMPSPHGFNKICSNDTLAADAAGTGNWKKGAASVKELYANETDTTPVGVAVYLKIADDSAAGGNWYYYERVPLDSPAPHDAKGVVADGFGSAGPAKTICVGCHAGAGMDAAHTPSPGARDFVYTPVP